VGAIISGSNWLFPAVEAVHIVALAVLCGAIIMLNLRLFGITLRQKAMAELAEELAPWTFCSLVIIVLTGVMLFSSEAMKAYTNVPFQVKMVFLFAAVIFHYTIYSKITYAPEPQVSKSWNRIAAVTSVILWFGVGVGGRAIGFL
jgi:hypothetical protein